jgi:hypothetical protein
MQTQQIHRLLQHNPFVVERMADFLYAILPLIEGGQNFTLEDCAAYLQNRVHNGYIREKSVIYDGLAKIFPTVRFEESPPELDHSGDVDYLGFVGELAFGVQIKPTTAKSNFGNYSVSERMKNSFADFTEEFSGKVFIVFSLDGEIANQDIIPEIATEIKRLHHQ